MAFDVFPTKTKYIIFSRNKKTRSQENVNISIYNTPIESQNEITFLGYRFDRFMSFSAQISYIKESIKSRLSILKIVSHSSWQLDNKTLLAIYSSTVRSIVDYSFVAYAVRLILNILIRFKTWRFAYYLEITRNS